MAFQWNLKNQANIELGKTGEGGRMSEIQRERDTKRLGKLSNSLDKALDVSEFAGKHKNE